MKGDFTSKGFMYNNVTISGFCKHFEKEEEFLKLIKSWVGSALKALRGSKYHYKVERIFEFYVDNDTYLFILPPFLKKENLTKKKYYNFEKIEEIDDYLNRNRSYIFQQIKDITENIIKGNNQFKTIQISADIFQNKQFRKINDDLETVFTDEQVVQLCSKLSTPWVRQLLVNSSINIKELHQIAMKCFNRYGGKIISFVLLLPIMDFGNRKSKYFIEKKDYEGEIPSFKLKFSNSGDEYYFSFYPNINKIKSDTKIATVFNKTQNVIEGFISFNGYMQKKVNNENLKLRLFVENLYSKNRVIYCGVADGYCLKCNRELSDPKSLRVGYGRECAAEIGIPYE